MAASVRRHRRRGPVDRAADLCDFSEAALKALKSDDSAETGCNATGDDWVSCRQRLIEVAFGEMPTKTKPDWSFPIEPRERQSELQRSAGETRRAPALGNNGGEVSRQSRSCLLQSLTGVMCRWVA